MMKSKLPPPVTVFLIKAAIIFVVWKLLYLLWLQPAQWPDRPLVELIAKQTTSALNMFHTGEPYSYRGFEYKHALGNPDKQPEYEGYMTRIFYEGKSLLLIVSNCNALELMVLFAGFVIAFPGKWSLKMLFIPAGIVAIHLVNVLRCMLLVSLANSSWKQFFNFTHHYLFTLTIYAFIFLLWVWFVKYSSPKNMSTAKTKANA